MGRETAPGRLAPWGPCLAAVTPDELLGIPGEEYGINNSSFVPFGKG